MSTITLQALGHGSEIGANSYLIGFDSQQIVIDCGLHPKKEGLEALPCLDLLEKQPLGVIVSHAHVDHCGAVPVLMKKFPGTECFATRPTVNIMDRMLHNSVSVMGTLALERGIKDYPLYSHEDAERAIRHTYGLGYRKEFGLAWGNPVRASFHPSGHVLGAASILLNLPGHTIFYTGDVCVSNQELMSGLAPLDDSVEVDTLVVESTRGAQADGNMISLDQEIDRFAEEITKVIKQRGVVLVPSFALGRSQEVLNVIARLQRTGRIPDVTVYASGLGRAIYEIYSRYTDYLRPEADLRPLHEFKRIGDVWERKIRAELLRKPAIIVATSGMMMENTPSAMLAQDVIKETHHGIFFVGYLDPDTLGYKLVNAEPGAELTFELHGKPAELKLENIQRFSFSAHAPREDLRWLVDHVNPKNVVFVHGDDDAVAWMAENCTGDYAKFVPRGADRLVLES